MLVNWGADAKVRYDSFMAAFGKRIEEESAAAGIPVDQRDVIHFGDEAFAQKYSQWALGKGLKPEEVNEVLTRLNVGNREPLSTADDARLRAKQAKEIEQKLNDGKLTFQDAMYHVDTTLRAGLSWTLTMPKDIEVGGVTVPNPLARLYRNEQAVLDKQRDPEHFENKLKVQSYYGIRGYDSPMNTALKGYGAPDWLADMTTYEFTDPVSVALNFIPVVNMLKLGGPALMGVKAIFSRSMARTLIENAAEASAFSESNLQLLHRVFGRGTGPVPHVRPVDAEEAVKLGREALANEFKKMGYRAPERQVRAVEAAVPGLPERLAQLGGRVDKLEVRRSQFQDIAKLMENLRPGQRQAALSFQVRQLNSAKEKLALEEILMKGKLLDDLPGGREWLERADMSTWVWDRQKFRTQRMPAGMAAEFHHNPRAYIDIRKGEHVWTKKGKRLAKVLGMDPSKGPGDDLVRSMSRFEYIGASEELANAFAAMKLLKRDASTGLASLVGTANPIKFMRVPRAALQSTPAYDHMVKASNAVDQFSNAKEIQLHQLLGGRLFKTADNTSADLVHGGPFRGGVATPAKITDDQQDALWILQGMEDLSDTINAERLAAGKKALSMDEAAKMEGVDEIAMGLDFWFKDFAGELMEGGILGPQQVLTKYLPRIWRGTKEGKSIDEIINGIEMANQGRTSMAEQAFFQMMRTGEVSHLERSIPKVLQAYSRAAYRQKYLKPAIDEVLEFNESALRSGLIDARVAAETKDWVNRTFHKTATAADAVGQVRIHEAVTTMRNLGLPDTIANAVEGALTRAGGVGGYMRQLNRRMSEMFYLGYMGFRPGLAIRNTVQRTLASSYYPPKETIRLLVTGNQRYGTDDLLRAAYHEVDLERKWTRELGSFLEAEFVRQGKDAGWDAGKIQTAMRDLGLADYMTADISNRRTIFAAAWQYIDEIADDPKAWKKVAGNLKRDIDGAEFMQAMRTGDFTKAKKIYGRAAVEDTQWHYNKVNRPAWAQLPVLENLYMFQSWPMNAWEVSAMAARRGSHQVKAGEGMLGAAFANAPEFVKGAAGATKGFYEFWGPQLTMAHVVNMATHGALGTNRWFHSQIPRQFLSEDEQEEGVQYAIGWPAALDIRNAIITDPVEGSAYGRAAMSFAKTVMDMGAYVSARGDEGVPYESLYRLMRDAPIVPLAFQPAVHEGAKALGIADMDPEDMNLMQAAIAAAAGVSPYGDEEEDEERRQLRKLYTPIPTLRELGED